MAIVLQRRSNLFNHLQNKQFVWPNSVAVMQEMPDENSKITI
jgi:hypothetical protein